LVDLDYSIEDPQEGNLWVSTGRRVAVRAAGSDRTGRPV
jgi:hypothetical protein